jgi:uncharacterized protein (TIGR03084 family)
MTGAAASVPTTGARVPIDLSALCDDLLAETADLEVLVAGLDPSGWNTPTPAEPWSVRDQIAHLAYFDDRALEAMADADRFLAGRAKVTDVAALVNEGVASGAPSSGHDTLARFLAARHALVAVARTRDPRERVPWYGPDMSVTSSVTARIMETWAHGQDVADALGVVREPTERLHHIAFLGVQTLAHSFRTRGFPEPVAPVRVELNGPGDQRWAFGPADAKDSVRGNALDFCLAVTQRRHLGDLSLEIAGPIATTWMTIAQAFAGPTGAGRAPGQFANR